MKENSNKIHKDTSAIEIGGINEKLSFCLKTVLNVINVRQNCKLAFKTV